MAALDEIVSVQISVEFATIDRAGFGTPLIAAYHNFWPDLVREFGTLDELTDAGVPVTHPIYIAMSKIFGQEFKPPTCKVGRRNTPTVADTYVFTPTTIEEGFVNKLTVNGTDLTYTNGAAETLDTIATAMSLLVNAEANVSSNDLTGSFDVISDVSGTLLNLQDWEGFTIECTTIDSGIAAHLAAILSADSNWYGLVIDTNSVPEIEGAAAWAQANRKLFGADIVNSDVLDSGVTDDVCSELLANNYTYTYSLFDRDATLAYGAAAWMGDRFPSTPGSSTWKFKNHSGVTFDQFAAGERSTLRAKNCNFYHRVSGAPITEEGVVASGQFIDVIRGIDWLQAEVQVNVFALLARSEKVPFTDAGIDSVRAEILRAINQGITNGLLAASPTPTVTAPAAADVNPIDKGARCLPDVEFTATLAGAIHKVIIKGKVSV